MDAVAVVCVGGGSGRRFGGDKLAVRLGGATVFERAVGAVSGALPGAQLVIVVPADSFERWRQELLPRFQGSRFVAGGPRRQDSVRRGVDAAADAGADVVVIHDAARPLVHPDDVTACVAAVGGGDGAVLCAPISDTVKQVGSDGVVEATLDRSRLRSALTPQVFRVDALRRAWAQAGGEGLWTDESALLEAAGCVVRWLDANHPNPKLTTAFDLELIRVLWESSRG